VNQIETIHPYKHGVNSGAAIPARAATHEKAAAEAKPRRPVCGGQLHKLSPAIADGRIKTAAIAGGPTQKRPPLLAAVFHVAKQEASRNAIIVNEEKQTSLAGLAATYSSKS
jgi:hypothetical protein